MTLLPSAPHDSAAVRSTRLQCEEGESVNLMVSSGQRLRIQKIELPEVKGAKKKCARRRPSQGDKRDHPSALTPG